MTDSTSEVVAGVLDRHQMRDWLVLDHYVCSCEEWQLRYKGTRSRGETDAAHRAHVADTIAAALGEREREAAEKAWDEGHRLTRPHSDRCEPTCPNPYRTDAGATEKPKPGWTDCGLTPCITCDPRRRAGCPVLNDENRQSIEDAIEDSDSEYRIEKRIESVVERIASDAARAAERALVGRVETVLEATEWNDWPGERRLRERLRTALRTALAHPNTEGATDA